MNSVIILRIYSVYLRRVDDSYNSGLGMIDNPALQLMASSNYAAATSDWRPALSIFLHNLHKCIRTINVSYPEAI